MSKVPKFKMNNQNYLTISSLPYTMAVTCIYVEFAIGLNIYKTKL